MSKVRKRQFLGYTIFSDGRVYSPYVARHLRPSVDRNGYVIVTLKGKHYKVHHLVLSLFVRPRYDGEVARHLDGNPANNDATNLCWGTQAENWNDKRLHGRATVGERHGRARLSEQDVFAIRKTVIVRHGSAKASCGFETKHTLARRYGVSIHTIDAVRAGAIWKGVQLCE